MNLSATLEALLQAQMNAEYGNMRAYEQLGAQLEAVAWDGYAEFFSKQADEELKHARLFRAYLIERNAMPALTEQPAVMRIEPEPRPAVEAALALEQVNTGKINMLYATARGEGDADVCIFLEQLVIEQRRSERELNDQLLKLIRTTNVASVDELDEHINET